MGRPGCRQAGGDTDARRAARGDPHPERAGPLHPAERTAVLICARRLCRDLLSAYLADSLGLRVLAAPDLGSVRPDALSAADAAVCCLEDSQNHRGLRKFLGRLPFVAVLCRGRKPEGRQTAFFVRCADGLSGLSPALERALGGRTRTERSRRLGGQRFLTARQLEVVTRVARGWTNARIGQALGLSPRTIEAHRLNAMKRLGVRTTAQLVAEAARLGLLGRERLVTERTVT